MPVHRATRGNREGLCELLRENQNRRRARANKDIHGNGRLLLRFDQCRRKPRLLYAEHCRNRMLRFVTVASFYMDQTEVANAHYREYLYWLERVFGSDFPEVVHKA